MVSDHQLLTPEGLARSICKELGLVPPFTARGMAVAAELQLGIRIVLEACPSGEYTTGWCAADDGVNTIYEGVS